MIAVPITNPIKITPEYWFSGETDSRKRYSYLAPDNTLWNVSEIDSLGDSDIVRCWAINAWGMFIYRSVNYFEFTRLWREIQP